MGWLHSKNEMFQKYSDETGRVVGNVTRIDAIYCSSVTYPKMVECGVWDSVELARKAVEDCLRANKKTTTPWWASPLIKEVDAQDHMILKVNPHVIALLKRIDPDTRCPECRGLGETLETFSDSPFPSWRTCPLCNGDGLKRKVEGRPYWVVVDEGGQTWGAYWDKDYAKKYVELWGGYIEKRFTKPGKDMEGAEL